MSKSKEIKKIIMEILKDGEVHTAEEIRMACLERGIIGSEEANIVRGAVFSLKKENENFVAVEKGRYKLEKEKDLEKCIEKDEFEEVIKYLRKKINMFKNFNWITCTDEELEVSRKQIMLLRDLSDEIERTTNM